MRASLKSVELLRLLDPSGPQPHRQRRSALRWARRYLTDFDLKLADAACRSLKWPGTIAWINNVFRATIWLELLRPQASALSRFMH